MQTGGILDARLLYFRPGLESASNSIILVSRIPPLLATAHSLPMDIVWCSIHTEAGRQTDRRISRSRAKHLFLFEETEGGAI